MREVPAQSVFGMSSRLSGVSVDFVVRVLCQSVSWLMDLDAGTFTNILNDFRVEEAPVCDDCQCYIY